MAVLRCYYAEEDDLCFTNGKLYEIKRGHSYYVVDDEGDYHDVDIAPEADDEWRPASSTARLIECDAAFSDEHEEEEWQRLEKNYEFTVCTDPKVHEACCDVALAYQLSQIQKFLRDSGADIELVVHKDFIAINNENCKEYRGNVEQILRYIKASGELARVAEEMTRGN